MTDFRALCAELHTAFNTYAVDESHHDLLVRARAALAQPELQAPTDEELSEFATDWWNGFAYAEQGADVATPVIDIIHPWHFADFSRDVLARWSRPTTEPVPVSDRLPGRTSARFEFSVFNSEYEEQAGGTAPTYSQALSEGQHYLAMYSQDGPHSLELRRVEVLSHHALPVPQQEAQP